LWRQYGRYLGDLAHGDLGPSFQYRDTSVNELIRQGLPVDALIGSLAMTFAIVLGGFFGIIAAVRRGSAWDHIPMFFAALGIAVPVFVIGPLLILLFAIQLHWLPAGDWEPGAVRFLILPVISLGFPYAAYIARMTRSEMIDVLGSPFIRTAWAKGLPKRTILLRHALRPVLTPLVSFLVLPLLASSPARSSSNPSLGCRVSAATLSPARLIVITRSWSASRCFTAP